MYRVKSHPFISFESDVSAWLGPSDWVRIGEAMSKCEHLSGYPLTPAAASHLQSVYLARGVHATTAIEGNTLSEGAVEKIVKGERSGVPDSQQYLEQEVKNVLEAIRALDESLKIGQRLPIDVERLCSLNGLILRKTPQRPEVSPGCIREHAVGVNNYRAPHWDDVRPLLESLVQWIDLLRKPSDESREARFFSALMAAILSHLYIAWIHPFGNGNGRLARLIEVQILSESGVVPMVATNVLSNHYNRTREIYYSALDAAQHDIGQFVRYSTEGFVDGLREQVDVVRQQSYVVHWQSFIHHTFASQPDTAARSRQRALALAMPQDAVTPEQATELTTHLAKLYARAGERIPARDLNDLAKMNLVVKVGSRRYRTNAEIMLAFIPPVSGGEIHLPPVRDQGEQTMLF